MLEKTLALKVNDLIEDAYQRGYQDGYGEAIQVREEEIYILYEGKNEESYRLKAFFDDWDSLIDFIRVEINMGTIKFNFDARPFFDEKEASGADILNEVLKNIYVESYRIKTRNMNE